MTKERALSYGPPLHTPEPPDTRRLMPGYLSVPYDDLGALERCLAQHGPRVAGFMLESVNRRSVATSSILLGELDDALLMRLLLRRSHIPSAAVPLVPRLRSKLTLFNRYVG